MRLISYLKYFCFLVSSVSSVYISSNTSEYSTNNCVSLSNTITQDLFDSMFRAAKGAALSYYADNNMIKKGKLNEACSCSLCKDSTENISVMNVYKGTVSGIILKNDDAKEIILAVKGTTTGEEWILNLSFVPVPYHPLNEKKDHTDRFKFNENCHGCTIHKGFYDGSNEIHNLFFDKLMELSDKNPDYKLIITGHSLGGALAPIIANEFLLAGKNPTVVSFGSPKIGNKAFSSWMDHVWNTDGNYYNLDESYHSIYKASYFRVSKTRDIVPKIPTKQMSYEHSGIDVYINSIGLPIDISHLQIKNWETMKSANQTSSEIEDSLISHGSYFLEMNICVKTL